ncbi:MAG: Gfo/Idh/MocA family oxidoreductase [Armatimonadetes bacterium]|nr:Gfo/Idh/MocA family oxidoreductase [Armatimonadota bacterium]
MIRVGVVGTGGMGKVHANHYRKIVGVELHAFDVVPDALAAYCDQFDAVPASSYADLVGKCDLIDVCLPTDLHLPYALEAIAAGRHVFIEKPMAGSFADAVKMMEAAEKADVKLVPGHVVRYFKDYQKGHDLVVAGAVGIPAAIRTRRGGKAPMGSGGWFRDATRSGGVLFDLAIHEFDWLRWTIGEVKSVNARSVAFSSEVAVDGDYGLATLEFESGAIAHVEATWLDPAGFRTTFEVCGSEGMIEYDSRHNVALRTTSGTGAWTDSGIVAGDDPYFNQLSAFVSVVSDLPHLPVTALDGVMAVSIAESAIQSAKTLRPVVVSNCF